MNIIAVMVRQGLIGVVCVALSLPVLWAMHGAFKLGAPPLSGVLLLGGSVVVAWIMGGLIGAAIGQANRGSRSPVGTLTAIGVGLLVGGVLCSVVAPFYAQSVLESLAREGAATVVRERGAIINRDTARAIESAKALAIGGATRLPSLSLLFWTLFGPAIAGFMEAKLAARR